MRRTTRRHLTCTALLGAAGFVAMFATGAAGQAKPQTPEKPKGDLAVSVVVEGGNPLTSGTIHVKNRQMTIGKAGDVVTAKGVTAGRVAVTVDASVPGSGSKTARRYLGVAEAVVEAGKTGKATVTVKPVDDLDAFCMGCHPDAWDPKVKVLPGQIVKDIHVSNRPLGEKYLAQVKTYNDTVAKLEKEGKPHNIRIVLEERSVVQNGKEVKQLFYTCESCHTLHLETPWAKYARAPYRAKSDLCVGCHY